MSRFTPEEFADIHFIYGYCNGNARAAEREYANRYPNRRVPDHRTFEGVHRRLRERGTVLPYYGEGTGNVRYDANDDEQILTLIMRNPSLSTRRVALQLGITKNKVWRVLRANHLHPFHHTPVQELLPNDLVQRAEFCRSLLLHEEHTPMYLESILWTDESQFTRTGVNNFHNLHEWSETNPHRKWVSSSQRRFCVNVWAGIIGNTFIGPILLPDRLNSESYLQFLIDTAPVLLDEIPLAVRNRVIYQQDGAPSHYGRVVQDWLNEKYPNRWIGRNGPIAWPPRSPDLTPLDFYVWGFLKDEVYSSQIDTRQLLISRIENACVKLRQNLENFTMISAIKRRLQLCLLQNGNHFENYL